MHATVLAGADLTEASFFETDLRDARFDGALLFKARFTGARNVPAALAAAFDPSGVYQDAKRFTPPAGRSEAAAMRVFVSKPGCLSYRQQQHVAALFAMLEAEGMAPQSIERGDYARFGAIGEVQRVMCDCAGAVIFGFKQLDVRDGTWRTGTPEEQQVTDMRLSTPWNQVESGMAVMQGLPVFVQRAS